MGHQKIINLLDNQTTKPFKFRTQNWFRINDDRIGNYIKRNLNFDTTMLKSS